jgi:hypothetical protein
MLSDEGEKFYSSLVYREDQSFYAWQFSSPSIANKKDNGNGYECDQNKKDANTQNDITAAADPGLQHGFIGLLWIVINGHVLSDGVAGRDPIRFFAAAVTVLTELDRCVAELFFV